MPTLLSVSSGLWTSSSTWGLVNADSYNNSEAVSVALSTTFQTSSDLGWIGLPVGTLTIQGIAVKVFSRSVSLTVDSTVRVRIRNTISGVVTGTDVSVLISRISQTTSGLGNTSTHWIYLKLPSPVVVTVGGPSDQYVLEISQGGSGGSQINMCANTGTNFSRCIVTTTNQAPGISDTMIICGEVNGSTSPVVTNVTYNNTINTPYGTSALPSIEIGNSGLLSFANSPGNFYRLISSGVINIGGGGTLSIGSSTSPMSYGATAMLMFSMSSNNQSQINIRQNGSLVTYGATKSGRNFLGVNAATGSSLIYTRTDSSWSQNDNIVIAGTTCSTTNLNVAYLSSSASATAVSIIPNLTRNKIIWPNTEVEIINLTRNVQIYGMSLSTVTIHQYTGHCELYLTNTEFRYSTFTNSVDNSSNTSLWGFAGPILKFDGCSFWDSPNGMIFEPVVAAMTVGSMLNGQLSVNDTVLHNMLGLGQLPAVRSANSVTFSNVWGMSASSVWAVLTGAQSTTVTHALTFDNCRFTNASAGIALSSLVTSALGIFDNLPLRITNCVFKNCSSAGLGQFSFGSYTRTPKIHDISENKSYFNVQHGFQLEPSGSGLNGAGWIIGRFQAFSNGISNLSLKVPYNYTFLGATLYGGPTGPSIAGLTATPTGISIISTFDVTFENFYMFGHTLGDVRALTSFLKTTFRNSFFGTSQSLFYSGGFAQNYGQEIVSSIHNHIVGSHLVMNFNGTMSSDYTIFRTTPNSYRLRPSIATSSIPKLESPSIFVPVKQGQTINVGIWVRTSVAGDGVSYNGNFPRLKCKSNLASGIGVNDFIVATATTLSSGNWQYISGNLPTSIDNTAYEVVVDCDGTTGWVNIDDMYISSQNSTKGFKYWYDGYPIPSSTTQNGNFVVL